MARSGVTREQVFETADALVREGQNPTVVAVRTRLGGGSPNTITPLFSPDQDACKIWYREIVGRCFGGRGTENHCAKLFCNGNKKR